MQKITPFLWFNDNAEEAINFYVSVFSGKPKSSGNSKKTKIGKTARYDEAGAAVSGRPKGSLMTASFFLDGQEFVALNGGPHFKFTEAVSFLVNCTTQEEIDYFWDKLSEGGDEKAQQCGWLKDKFGLSWQIVPTALSKLLSDPDPEKSKRVMNEMLKMKKLDLNVLQEAHNGK